jgi:hypothetical protein
VFFTRRTMRIHLPHPKQRRSGHQRQDFFHGFLPEMKILTVQV